MSVVVVVVSAEGSERAVGRYLSHLLHFFFFFENEAQRQQQLLPRNETKRDCCFRLMQDPGAFHQRCGSFLFFLGLFSCPPGGEILDTRGAPTGLNNTKLTPMRLK